MLTDTELMETSQKLYSIDEFNLIIMRERFRSDRNNQKFSLVTFDIGSNKDTSLISHLFEIITSRVRISDEIGWFDERRIAILLPDTELKDAQRIAHSLCKNSKVSAPTPGWCVPACTVYMYPSLKWIDGESYTEPSCPQVNVHEKIAVGHRMPFWKRSMDIIGSAIGLLILSPLLLFVAVMIKLVSHGPIFFAQERIGKSRRIFKLLKFRSMKVDNDVAVHREYLKELINGDGNGDKPMVKMESDDRIFPFGRFIRKTCLDELPQLINVFKGDMSLVGPRPCIPYEAEDYLRWHARRFDITPGMTGLWQVSGKNRTTFKEMIRLDIKYAVELTFWLDIMILFKTPFVVFKQMFDDINKFNDAESNKTEKILSAVEIA